VISQLLCDTRCVAAARIRENSECARLIRAAISIDPANDQNDEHPKSIEDHRSRTLRGAAGQTVRLPGLARETDRISVGQSTLNQCPTELWSEVVEARVANPPVFID
jgi:hypothetical protein